MDVIDAIGRNMIDGGQEFDLHQTSERLVEPRQFLRLFIPATGAVGAGAKKMGHRKTEAHEVWRFLNLQRGTADAADWEETAVCISCMHYA